MKISTPKNAALLAIMVSLCFAGCGDDNKGSNGGKSGSSDLSLADCSGIVAPDPIISSNESEPSEDPVENPDKPGVDIGDYYDLVQNEPTVRRIPGNQIKLTFEGRSTSLCELLKLQDSQLVMFHLVKAKCFECLEAAKQVGDFTDDQGILHVLVFSDSASYVSDEDLEELPTTILPGSVAARDDKGTFLSFFSQNEEEWVPTVIAMNEASLGFYVENPQNEEETLVSWANSKLGTTLSSKKK